MSAICCLVFLSYHVENPDLWTKRQTLKKAQNLKTRFQQQLLYFSRTTVPYVGVTKFEAEAIAGEAAVF